MNSYTCITLLYVETLIRCKSLPDIIILFEMAFCLPLLIVVATRAFFQLNMIPKITLEHALQNRIVEICVLLTTFR